jgi:glycine/D-amino acid oxidase-like deaminating enzyme/nitrite reductase/ring-hydroxylating ferredoxin subunit
MAQLPKMPQSYWIAHSDIPPFPKLNGDMDTDVVIVGAGMTGITIAYLLTQAGKRVILLEAGRALHGTTGHTTAKITVQHDLIYDELIQHFGEEKARLYYEANRNALQWMQQTVEKEQIACDWAKDEACLYALSANSAIQLEKELDAYRRLGIPGDLQSGIRLDLPVTVSLTIPDQARFDPLAYLTVLLKRAVDQGAQLFEQTTVMKVEEGDSPVVITEEGYRIRCRHVVSASHFPFLDWKGFYFARLEAKRSYVLAVRVAQPYEGGMYLSVDEPKRSIRLVRNSEGEDPLLLIGGEGHKAGQSECTIRHYEALQTFAETLFDVREIAWRWSTQDLESLDKVPYVGPYNARSTNILVATGYRKWGMTNSTAAAHILTNYILDIRDPYLEVFSPSRLHADPDIQQFFTRNADVAKQLIEGKLDMTLRKPGQLRLGEGGVVRIGIKRAGAYRTEDGTLHVVDTTCTHMGCETKWNDADRTWDCPCHGSRYAYTGEVIEGPAKEPLAKLEVGFVPQQ